MLRLPSGTLTALAALALLWVLPGPAGAQERKMRFRPVPAESTDVYERGTSVRITRSGRGETTHVAIPPMPAVPAVPPVPPMPPLPSTDPEDAESPRVRSTTGDLVRFGSDITVGEDQVVEGDVVSFGGDVDVHGRVTGNVSAMGGDLTLRSSARVDGDVVCMGGTLREEPGSQISGKRVTAARGKGSKLLFPMLAVVGTGVKIMMHGMTLLFVLGFAWLFVKLAPERTRAALDTIEQEPGPSFVIGLLLWALIIPSVIALALVIALLCITIIGIPLAVAVAVGYAAFFVIAALWGSIVGYGVLGSRLYPRFRSGLPTLMQGVVWGAIALHGMRIAADLLQIVPLFGFVGGLLTFMHFVIAIGLGTLGAGSLVRGEYRRRSVQTWWARMRPAGSGPNDMPPPQSPPPPPPAPPTSPSSSAEVIS